MNDKVEAVDKLKALSTFVKEEASPVIKFDNVDPVSIPSGTTVF